MICASGAMSSVQPLRAAGMRYSTPQRVPASRHKRNIRINGIKKWQRPAGRCLQKLKEESVATKCIRTPHVTGPKTASSCEPEPFSDRPDHLPRYGLRRAHRPGAGGRGAGRLREHPATDAIDIRWKGKIEDASEQLLVIKSAVARFPAIRDRLRTLHPYELPEIIAVPIADGLPEYLAWLNHPE